MGDVCVSVVQRDHSGDVCQSASILVRHEHRMGTFICSELDEGATDCSGGCCCGVM